LKNSQARVDYELALAYKKKLNIGIKLVRGAYLVEETKLCQKHGTVS
jgi:proline dehydrogenase